MALYKYEKYLDSSSSDAFDTILNLVYRRRIQEYIAAKVALTRWLRTLGIRFHLRITTNTRGSKAIFVGN